MSAGRTHFEPLVLLFAAGGFIGLIFPLAKIAGDRGVSPLLYAGSAALVASLVLLAIGRAMGGWPRVGRADLRYALIAGAFTFALPFGALVAVIPHTGAGVPAILQSLAPILTLAIVYAIGFESPRFWRVVGLGLGLAGVLIIMATRGMAAGAENIAFAWYLAALVTPLGLAIGNVYRSVGWPAGGKPVPLAALTLAAAALLLLGLALVFALVGGAPGGLDGFLAAWPLGLVQGVVTGIGYAFFFRLQQVGGPVYLSQISYVNTAVGVAFAVLAFGERLSLAVWLAIGIIFAGIALVTLTGRAGR